MNDALKRELATGTYATVEQIIFRVDPRTKESGITPGSLLVADLNLDSYDRIEIALAIEETYNIEVAEDDQYFTKTFQDLVDKVIELRAVQASA